jgi:predicted 3-demethylubiquinone-9 3-methyltransferase (glyoxalase superfamily)
MSKISPFLWFDMQAEEAAKYYVSLFKNSKMGKISRYPKGTPFPEGTVMTATFTLEGQEFTAMNGGPTYKFTPAISFFVNCETQAEIDLYWDKLLADGGKPMGCGWIADKFGLCWQIVPAGIGDLIGNPDKSKAERATAAMLQMTKLDIEKLRNA